MARKQLPIQQQRQQLQQSSAQNKKSADKSKTRAKDLDIGSVLMNAVDDSKDLSKQQTSGESQVDESYTQAMARGFKQGRRNEQVRSLIMEQSVPVTDVVVIEHVQPAVVVSTVYDTRPELKAIMDAKPRTPEGLSQAAQDRYASRPGLLKAAHGAMKESSDVQAEADTEMGY